METNNKSGGGYELPDVNNVFTPEDATSAVNKVWADVRADPQHPYMDKNHPQYGEFVERMNRLSKVKYQDADPRSPKERAMEAGLEKMQQQQTARTARGRELYDELGLDEANIPEDIAAPEITCLEIVALSERGQWDEALRLVDQELCRLRAPDKVCGLFAQYQAADPKEREQMEPQAKEILQYILSESRRRLALPPVRPTKTQNTRDETHEGD